MSQQKQHPKALSTFGLVMLNVAAVMSLRGLPMIADTGLTMVFYLLFATVLFLIPCSLVSAELATGWPGPGGVYRWVKVAFGARWGFVAIWLQWIQNVVWYPMVLVFAASGLAYLFEQPQLTTHRWYNAVVVIVVYWVATLVTFRGLRIAGIVTTLGAIGGTLIPGLLLVGLGLCWVFAGHSFASLTAHSHFLPSLSHFSNIAFLAGILLLFAGMEVGSVHVHELSKPKQQYPRAVFIAAAVIFVVFSLGSIAVGIVIPRAKISLTAGLMQAFSDMLTQYHLTWLLPILGVLLAFGAIAGVMAWISGPSKGLLATAKNGEIPPFLAHTNKRNVQTHILLIQAMIVTALTSLFFVMKSISAAFFLLTAITITLYLVMYLLMFAAAIRLRYSHPEVPRAYKIPGGNWGMWMVAGIAWLGVLFAFVIAFFPPARLEIGTPVLYVGMVVAGLIVFIGLPLIIHACKQPSWIDHKNVKPE